MIVLEFPWEGVFMAPFVCFGLAFAVIWLAWVRFIEEIF